MLGCKRSKIFELLRKGILERAPRYGRDLRIYRVSVEKALMPRSKKKREVIRRSERPAGFSFSDIVI